MAFKETEQQIQKAIIDYLRLKKYVVVKHHSTGFAVNKDGGVRPFRYGERGVSDIIACSPKGRFWAIEVKRKGGRPTPDQIEFLGRIIAAGGKGILAHSLDDIMVEVGEAMAHLPSQDM